ncbi:hypothetical protein MNBD_NITROSPINAE02-1263 [hydrothermal vent metagenome]|uniref:Uncharacterized protein n=1 Tax=hydrothermal vent metagenome TaxID=652676 RepID=A0A3B1BC67_9ZZZZ
MKVKQEPWVGAPRYWHKLVEIYSDKLKANPRAHLYVPLADALLNLGRINDAIFALEDGLNVFPNSRAARIMLARISYDKGRYKIAKKILEEVVASWPDSTAAVTLLCRIYDNEMNKDSALKISLGLLDHMPDSNFAKSLVTRYTDGDRSAPRENETGPAPAPYATGMQEAAPYYEHEEIPIFEKVKAMARLETLLYRINQLKSRN